MPDHEDKRQREKQLQREVLRHLKDQGESVDYTVLHAHFAQQKPGEIGPALEELELFGLIERVEETKIKLTDSGMHLMDDPEYWREGPESRSG